MDKTTKRYTGRDAVRATRMYSGQLECYANPLDEGGPITAEMAMEIIHADPSLVYADVRVPSPMDIIAHYWDPAGLITADSDARAEFRLWCNEACLAVERWMGDELSEADFVAYVAKLQRDREEEREDEMTD